MTDESILYIFKFPKVCILIVAFIGEYQSFVDLTHFFKQIESLGTKVLVEPGNHDIADGWVRKFIEEKNFKTRQLTATEFLSLFSPLNTVYF